MRGTLISGCPDLITPVYEAKKKKVKVYPCHVNRASEAGHPCEKYLVLSRTHWQERLPHEAEVEFIFEGGRMVEKMALNDLDEAGFTVIEQNRAFSWKEFELSGHVDCKILIGNENAGEKSTAYPVEIKGLNQFDFDKLDTIEDFLMSKKSWIKKYPAQLALYMLMSNIDKGCFYIKRIPGFRPKQIWIDLDFTFAEEILKKLERVNKHVKEETLPEGQKDYDICNYCSFLHICLPDMVGTEIEIINEQEVEEAINRCQELKPLVSEYNKTDKFWKAKVKEKEKILVGGYIITGKWITKKGFTTQDSEYWQSKILIKPETTANKEAE